MAKSSTPSKVTVVFAPIPALDTVTDTLFPDADAVTVDAALTQGADVPSAMTRELSDDTDMFPADHHLVVRNAEHWKVADLGQAFKALANSTQPETPITLVFSEFKKLPKIITSVNPTIHRFDPPSPFSGAQATDWVTTSLHQINQILIDKPVARHIVEVIGDKNPDDIVRLFASTIQLHGTRVSSVSELPAWLHRVPDKEPTPFMLAKALADGHAQRAVQLALAEQLCGDPYRVLSALISYWNGMIMGSSYIDRGSWQPSLAHQKALGSKGCAQGLSVLNNALVNLQLRAPSSDNGYFSRDEYGEQALLTCVSTLLSLDRRINPSGRS